MKFLYDFFPILLFFVAYKLGGIYVATGVAMVAAVAQISYGWFVKKQVENMHWISAGLILVFGGMTLVLHDPVFIMWKPTILNWLFALVFAASAFFGTKPLVQRMMEHVLTVPTPIWHRVNWAWVAFFVLSGAVNIYVAYHYSQDAWVNFKLFGLMGMTFVFMILQGIYLARYAENTAEVVEAVDAKDPERPS
ncbi:septation protein A [Halothiobacillus diazotrophicus]|uniref:Inner membrane-spanning protein YciB n=1 Tax=Halothiobacillus diazotrophicus TaxID=1860122 RepID=A0A191ZJE1_9GAMM|nr:septation protein A [Halothiobacillus diazotrophicus]ANJ68004.1 septation protein A [Halothiobacillus diazotrophicus]